MCCNIYILVKFGSRIYAKYFTAVYFKNENIIITIKMLVPAAKSGLA